MLNYRLFLPHVVAHQAPLHDILSGPRVKGSHTITWTPELLKAFEECKASLSHATLLAHLNPSTPLALITDASMSALGTVLQQRVQNAWQPLTFYPKKLNPEVKPIAAPQPSTLQPMQPQVQHHWPRHHRPSRPIA